MNETLFRIFSITFLFCLILTLSACDGGSDSSDDETNVSVLTRGSPLHGANGLMFDDDDRLHIASVFGREIVIADPQTGEIINRIGNDKGVEGPDDIAIAPDGTLYWTSIATGEIGRLRPSGEKTTIANLPIGVNPITFSNVGRLFVALCFFGDALYEIDPNGSEAPRVIADDLGGGCAYNGFDWGPDGYLYAPGFFRDEIVRINVDTGETAIVAQGFGTPNAVKFNSNGELFVLDTERGEVVRVNTTNGEKKIVAQLRPNLDNLAFDSQDRLYVSAADDGWVGEVLDNGSVRTVIDAGLSVPGGIALLDGTLYIADHYSLVEIDPRTGRQTNISRAVTGVSPLSEPLTVSADGNQLILTSYLANTVQIWDPVAALPKATYVDFSIPMNAIRYGSEIVVAELGTGRVVAAQVDDPTSRRVLADGLQVPLGLAATDNGLWVSDWATGQILQLVAAGEVLVPPRVIATELRAPEGLAVTDKNRLYVVESTAKQLAAINLDTGQKSVVADDLALGAEGIDSPVLPPTWIFNGVTVAESGDVYVTGDIDNVVYRIKPADKLE